MGQSRIPSLTLLLLSTNSMTPLTTTSAYEIGCIYPPNMLEPFAARAKIIGFTGVYNGDLGLETPIAVHQAQAFSYCDVNCLAHHDASTLNAITKTRPTIVVPEEMGHNSWSRMMCIAQCYGVLFEREGNGEALETIRDTWKLDVRSGVEVEIGDYFTKDYARVEEYIASPEVDYDPLTIGRLVVHEILLFTKTDGWNSDGAMRHDPISGTSVPCTSNCIPYRDTYGYYPRNHLDGTTDTDTNKYTVTGKNLFWQPLLEHDGRGSLSRQEHVTPHIGFRARPALRDPATHTPLPPPDYDYTAEAALVLDRLRASAVDTVRWDKIAFYDKKFLVRLLLQESMRKQFGGELTFEDELLFTHGISAAEYDAVLAAWREKVVHDLVRPTTVVQRWGADLLKGAFDGDRGNPGLKDIRAGDMHAFVRVMPHSEYPSGSSCICETYREFTELYTAKRFGEGESLKNMYWGYGGVDFGCDEMSLLDPSRADFLGCKQGGFAISDMDMLAKECGESRLWGGMHFTASVPAGVELCKGLGTLGVEHMELIRNGSTLGSTHVKKGERPICSTHTMSPTDSPTDGPTDRVTTIVKTEVLKDERHDDNSDTGHDSAPIDDNENISVLSRGYSLGIGAAGAILLSNLVFNL